MEKIKISDLFKPYIVSIGSALIALLIFAASSSLLATKAPASLLSHLIAYEFYRSKDGKLRKLLIWDFASKVWFFGGIAVFGILFNLHVIDCFWNNSLIIFVTPLFLCKIRLYLFIKK